MSDNGWGRLQPWTQAAIDHFNVRLDCIRHDDDLSHWMRSVYIKAAIWRLRIAIQLDDAVISKTPSGYLAVTPEGHRFHIGVLAESEAEAVRLLSDRVFITETTMDGPPPDKELT